MLISFFYGFHELDKLHALDLLLDKTLAESPAGRYDGHEINMDGTDGTLFFYGPNAETLFKAVLPVLRQTDFMRGATALLRFGGLEEEVSEIEVEV